jgi:putative ATPase
MPECAINLGHGVVYLAVAPKDRRAYDGLRAAQADVTRTGNLEIPLKVRNAPTGLMKEMGYGKGYEMYPVRDARRTTKDAHDGFSHEVDDTEDYRPSILQKKRYYAAKQKKKSEE